ncbi:MAG: FAD binding domain-containing protein [Deltaproteobacteria bacterium]|nr:FAD binding domain-containing protein [Deltaproteobacteria bacterium]
MALRSFSHTDATSIEHAAALAAPGPEKVAVIAGGTDLLGALKDNIHPDYPELLVNLKTVVGLRGVTEDKRGLRIGALTTLHDLAVHPVVRSKLPVLAEAARSVASPELRRMGTAGGNVCQEPRCWYYRCPDNRFHCLRKGGDRCNAILGENRYHSIFGAARAADPSCTQHCPAHVSIPSYMARIRAGDMRAAAEIVLDCNPMPAITGRVCPHYCERGCNRCDFDEPVSVRQVERSLGDWVLEHAAELYVAPKRRTGKRVAVIGAGPAGLSAAFYLRRAGHGVTVFDALPEAGGMLVGGIPAYRLPAEVVRRQVAAYAGMGIEFRMGEAVGRGPTSLAALRKAFDAVFLGTGAWKEKRLGLEHEEKLDSGLRFLAEARSGAAKSVGRRVLVIGGGNVAVDVAISALRLGAKEVTMACLERRDQMPAFPEDLEQAQLERVKILPSWGPSRVLLRDGVLAGMELVRCTDVFDAQGRFAPAFDAGTKTTVEADQVLVAIGTGVDVSYAGKAVRTAGGRPVVDEATGATSASSVFAGGDMTRGPASVVEALAAGRRAALAIHRELGGVVAKEGDGRISRKARQERQGRKGATGQGGTGAGGGRTCFEPAALGRSRRATTIEVAVGKRTIGGEDRGTLAAELVEGEVRRCLDCGCVAVNASDLATALVALGASIRTNRRTIAAEEFFDARPRRSTVLEPGELVTELVVPPLAAGTRQAFLKFRTRRSIDFPIASAAVVMELRGGRIGAARIVLGAVAPVPVRAAAAEAFLRGKRPDGETAAKAAALAVEGATPLGENRFKVAIVKALVARAIRGGSAKYPLRGTSYRFDEPFTPVDPHPTDDQRPRGVGGRRRRGRACPGVPDGLRWGRAGGRWFGRDGRGLARRACRGVVGSSERCCMTTWEMVAEKMKDLPPERQQEVLDFVEFVRGRAGTGAAVGGTPGASSLAGRLAEIRRRIEASGEPLLDVDGVLREVAERRGGVSALEAGADENVR